MVLLSGAGLLLRSFYELTHVNTGFKAEHVLTFHVGAEWGEDRAAVGRLQRTILSELQRLPQVQAAGLTNFLPADNATLGYPVVIEDMVGEGENSGRLGREPHRYGGLPRRVADSAADWPDLPCVSSRLRSTPESAGKPVVCGTLRPRPELGRQVLHPP